jgi:hypothetical protein
LGSLVNVVQKKRRERMTNKERQTKIKEKKIHLGAFRKEEKRF